MSSSTVDSPSSVVASQALQFQPLASVAEPSFWHQLSNLKLNVFKLDDSAIPVVGYLTPGRTVTSLSLDNAVIALPASIFLSSASFDPSTFKAPPVATVAPGLLKNTNTVEEFKRLDKHSIFNQIALQIWKDIKNGQALLDPTLLLRFFLVTFADLKKHKFIYWFAFPAITLSFGIQVTARQSLADSFSVDIMRSISTLFCQHASEFAFLVSPDGPSAEYAPLSELPQWIKKKKPIFVAFIDPAALSENPGWPLRNLLLCLAYYGVTTCTLLSARNDLVSGSGYQDKMGSLSTVWSLQLASLDLPSSEDSIKATGWERLNDGKLSPRSIDMSHMMDPKRLAEDAVHLNLSLMKWRILPELNLGIISSTKCLLLGAGTLGCYVARGLLAWGVQQITFVDYGKVSYSNPVRQPLFTFDDCLDGGRDKAVAAAERAKKILPTLKTEGHAISIPMPGHPILDENQFQEAMIHLETLIKEHDAIFLLMDSRESRWLPTLLGALHEKIVINAALGFDSFVVIRHTKELGCYYCNDVVAPTDSLSDRTLDQMCTVTRPGLAAIAGAYSVELMTSLLNHVDKINASTDSPGVLGKVPHQIRGFLSSHETLLISGQAYDKCTACSNTIKMAYKSRGIDFVRDVCNSPDILEQLTGLDQLKQDTDAIIDSWAEEEEESDDM